MLLKFIRYAVKNPMEVGAFFPSSRFLAYKMIENIDFEKSVNLVEIGAGTGAITSEILNRMRPDSRLFCFEKNSDFFSLLKEIKDDRLILINDRAENIKMHLKSYELKNIDCVISTLPLATLPNSVVDEVLTRIKEILSPEGVYTQLQYSLFSLKKVKSHFSNVKISFTPLNYYPSFVYTSKK